MSEHESERLPGRPPESLPASEPQRTAAGVKRARKKRAGSRRLEHAFRKFREGPGREAQDLYRDVVSEAPPPSAPAEHVSRGVRYDEGGQHDLAIEEFSSALASDPENARVMANLAAAYAAVGRFGEAEREIQRALRLEPESVEARASQGIDPGVPKGPLCGGRSATEGGMRA